MKKNIFYRDFTICKAVALVALMGLAAALGGVPSNHVAEAQPELSKPQSSRRRSTSSGRNVTAKRLVSVSDTTGGFVLDETWHDHRFAPVPCKTPCSRA